MKKIIFILFIFLSASLYAQEGKVTGAVTDDANAPLPGVSVKVKGSTKATSTDFDGKFSINAKKGDVLLFSYVGLESKSVIVDGSVVNISLSGAGEALENIVLLGTRTPGRTVTESAVPIDVIAMKDIATQGAQANLNQILNMVAPSFTSNTQTVADGTDHIDPAQLRGLGPDQVLVLVNGKRRHTSSLVNINGTPGKGSVGTDLNAIPAFAIDKIEVLRDGASAQYGSDAIAGVINVGVKKATNKLEVAVYGGSYVTLGANNHKPGNDGNTVQVDANYGFGLGKEKSFINITASAAMRNPTFRAKEATDNIYNAYNAVERLAAQGGVDINALFRNINNTADYNQAALFTQIKNFANQVSYFTPTFQASINSATTLSQLQGLMGTNFTTEELAVRGKTRSDFNMRVGQSNLQSGQVFVNGAYPINDNMELYAFGGYSTRTGDAAGFYRRPNNARSNFAIYPNGFLPEIHSQIDDISFAAGLRGKFGNDWNFDLSNTYGQNTFDYSIENTLNASLKNNTKNIYDAGGLAFSQNTANLDINKKFGKTNVAFGAEARFENFTIREGEQGSYTTYDIFGNPVTTASGPANQLQTDFFGNTKAGGSQVFPGFSKKSAINEGRTSFALYGDIEYDLTEKWLVNGAIRYENYSDFGGTTNFKLATRYKIVNNFNFRGAISTGFRAPSLHQIYFGTTSTQFGGGTPVEVGTFPNNSAVAKTLGIPQLKQEESQSVSVGFTAKVPAANLTITADAYIVKIVDRVIITDQFSKPSVVAAATPGPQQDLFNAFTLANASSAVFFTNGIDTESKGIDLVISHKLKFGNRTLKTDFAGTISQTRRVGNIHASPILEAAGQINTYFSELNRVYLEEAVPRVKGNLTHTLNLGKVNLFLRNVYFGQVTDPNPVDANSDGFVGAVVQNGKAVENEHLVMGGKTITDFSVSYNFNKNFIFTLGANNILDIYPRLNLGPIRARRANGVDSAGNVTYAAAATSIDLSNSNQFVYSRNVSQFGQNGRFIFARINFKF